MTKQKSADIDPSEKYVFLDTEVFIQQNFQYERGLLAAFSQHVQSNRVQLIITEVTVDEIIDNISNFVDDGFSALQSLRTKGRILRNSKSPNIAHFFKDHKRNKILNDLKKQFRTFLSSTNAVIIPVDTIKPSVVFKRYFSSLPPFHNPKKKAEFPDAFSLEILYKYCEENNIKLNVVSNDPDWKEACKVYNFDHFEMIDGFLQSLQKETDLFQSARELLEYILPKSYTYGSKIQDEGKNDQLRNLESKIYEEFQTLGFFVADRDAIVTNIEVENINYYEHNVVNVTPDTIDFSLELGINYTAYLEYLSNRGIPGHISEMYARRSPFSDLGHPQSVYEWARIRIVATINWDPIKKTAGELLNFNIVNPTDFHVYVENYES
ncbi:PIN domain-containing protein [Rhodohalobacter sp. 614A]|uniref:PIN domain-containing protein n=1 Tax=Rhodohalobacter sp. 614A TaxID=2908649 RepID=UPI001F2566BB|nr:PIN domain-containing protein [Rhodohalobacter sp. 614A]